MSSKKHTEKHTITTDEEWAVRHLHEADWVENYWKSRDHPHRLFLLENICKYSPTNSILEIGSACGANLYHIAKKFPETKIKGIDINPLAVQKGNEWFKAEGISNVILEVGRVQNLEQIADKKYDIVLTDAVLIYMPPDEIEQIAKKMLRVGKVLILNEWYSFNKTFALFLSWLYYLKTRNASFRPKSAQLGLYVGHWVRDYKALFEKFVAREKIRVTKLPKKLWEDKNWQRWGALVEVVQ